MTEPLEPLDLLVPPMARLLHAGMPKTGTTALQQTAAGRRDLLLEHGVRYPGTGANHRKAMFAFSARPVSWAGPGAVTPKMARWSRLRDEVRGETERRVWLSNENLSEEPEEVLRSLLDEVGGPAVVALTVRSLPAQLASAWQQYLKSGVWISFETWLQRTIGDSPHPGTTPSFAVRCAVGDVVEKWVRLCGADRVVVVVLDPQDHGLVPRTFERLLGLPPLALEPANLSGHQANRSMTAPEAELVRRVNRGLRELGDVDWRDYERYVRNGAVAALLGHRTPRADEQRVVPPTWAVDTTVRMAEEQSERIRALGVRVVGDLSHLASRVPSVDRVRPPTTVPVDAAAQALVAVLSAALGRDGSSAGPAPVPQPESPRVEELSTAALARTLARRVRGSTARAVRRAVARRPAGPGPGP